MNIKSCIKLGLVLAIVGGSLFIARPTQASFSLTDPIDLSPTPTICRVSSVYDPSYVLSVQMLYKVFTEDGQLASVISCAYWNCSFQIRRNCDNKLITTRTMTWPNTVQYIRLPKDQYTVVPMDTAGSLFTPNKTIINLDKDKWVQFVAPNPLIQK